jgi:hypothetical protein
MGFPPRCPVVAFSCAFRDDAGMFAIEQHLKTRKNNALKQEKALSNSAGLPGDCLSACLRLQ